MNKVAIAKVKREGGFTPLWVEYCEKNNIPYKIVNPYANDIIQQVSDCDAFLWHFHQGEHADMKCAKAILASLQMAGKRVFPDVNTGWWFDNKVHEKYLLEAIGAPLVKSYVFYSKSEALKWVNETEFPKVFKLKGGAGSTNVKLIHSRREAIALVNKAFGKGFPQYDWKVHVKEAYRKYKLGKASLRDIFRPIKYGMRRYPTTFSHYHGNEIGYAYFQDFIKGNAYDTRVVIVSSKYAVAEKRYVRKGDFRASGSGKFDYENIDTSLVKIAFDVANKLKFQTVAFDFIYDNKEPKIVEISYGFGIHGASHCPGYWTNDMQWHRSDFIDFGGWMINSLIK